MAESDPNNPDGPDSADLLGELFPINPEVGRQRSGRRRATDRNVDQNIVHIPVDVPVEIDGPDYTPATRRERPGVVGVACAGIAVLVRLGLTSVLPAVDIYRLGLPELAIGVFVVLVVAWSMARASVSVVVCAALACALASLDVAAPVGIALVLAAVLATRNRSR